MKKYYIIASCVFIILALIPIGIKEFMPYYTYKKTMILLDEFSIEKKQIKFDVAYQNVKKLVTKWPDSIYTFQALAYLNPGGIAFNSVIDNSSSKNLYHEYNELMQKYYSDINNVNVNTAEKLLLMHFMVNDIFGGSVDNQEKCYKILIKMKDECNDKNYAALATLELFQLYPKQYQLEFIKKFPTHPAIPYVELERLMYEIYYGDKNINDYDKFIEKYKNLQSPDGWNFKVDCDAALFYTYYRVNNSIASKYLKILQKECPYYPLKERQRNKIYSNFSTYFDNPINYKINH